MVALKAPKGKFRVVGIDLFDGTRYLVKDVAQRGTAFALADEHNKKRESPLDDVYYVYDDDSNYIRGNEAVGQQVSP